MEETLDSGLEMSLEAARKIIKRRLGPDEALDTQENLLETIMLMLGVANYARLGRRLVLQAPMLSKWRHNRLVITADGYVTMNEETGIPVGDLRRMAGDYRPHTRPSAGPDPRVVAGVLKRTSD